MDRRRLQNTPLSSRSGFSLIELLLVVTVLAVLAMLQISRRGSAIQQVRYEDTQNRLGVMRSAILGHQEVSRWSQGNFNGFVADNGRLPTDIQELLSVGDQQASFESVAPIFYAAVDDAGYFANGYPSYYSYGESDFILNKGHRGTYLSGEGRFNQFCDGWGNGAGDTADLDHGWHVDTTTGFEVYSFGIDGAATEPQMASITTNSWMVDLSGAVVRIYNESQADFDFSIAPDLGEYPSHTDPTFRVSLLIYQNHAESNQRWRRIQTAELEAPNLYLDGDGDCWVSDHPAHRYMDLVFPEGTRVPAGEHLILPIVQFNSALGDVPLRPEMVGVPSLTQQICLAAWSGGSFSNVTEGVAQRVRFLPGMSAPKMELQLK